MGRLTLNPIPHIDPIGSILIPLVSFMTAGTVLIAWAKPVPVNPMNFRNMRRDDILVSVVGPLSNLIVALACALFYVFTTRLFGPVESIPEGMEHEAATFVTRMFSAGITMNVFLAVFNLIPVPPLDGSHVVSSLLPENVGERFRQVGFMGILIILVLMRIEPFRQLVFSIVLAIRAPYIFLVNQLL